MRISDWSSDVCSSDLQLHRLGGDEAGLLGRLGDDRVAGGQRCRHLPRENRQREVPRRDAEKDAAPVQRDLVALAGRPRQRQRRAKVGAPARSEEQTSELQSLMRISYAVFCLKKKK